MRSWDRSIGENKDAMREAFVGKTVERITFPEAYTDYKMVLHFTDGSAITLLSYDYEGYSSGIYIMPYEAGDD